MGAATPPASPTCPWGCSSGPVSETTGPGWASGSSAWIWSTDGACVASRAAWARCSEAASLRGMQPIRIGLDLLRLALDATNRLGDLTYAGLTRNVLIINLLFSGDPLA